MIRALSLGLLGLFVTAALAGCGGGVEEGMPENVDFTKVPPPVSASMKPAQGSRTAQPKNAAAPGVMPAMPGAPPR